MSVKAFDLTPVLEKQKVLTDKGKTQITCLECCGKNLYIATDDCSICHYLVEEKQVPTGKIIFDCKKQGFKSLGLKKPVIQMKAASALNRIIILVDMNILLLNMLDLELIVGASRIKAVTSFCLNPNPLKSNPFAVEICVAQKKKNLHIYTVMEDKISLVREITTPEPPMTMVMEGAFVCAALQDQYKIYDYNNGAVQDLFPFDSEHLKPIITQISREEFLLSAPSALGMFASTTGFSQRPPLQWSNNLLAIAYSHPYVLALSDEFITVHSILDQQQKQSIPFQGGQLMGEYDGKLYVSSRSDIYALTPVAIEKQIQALLVDKRVTEALGLAKHARKTGLSKEKFKQMYQRIQQQAGFIEFAEGNFREASDLFHTSKLDVRELLTLYPELVSAGSYTRAVPPLHEIADVTQITRGDKEKRRKYNDFLRAFLEDTSRTRGPANATTVPEYAEEVNTALLKLYAEDNSPDLLPLITSTDLSLPSPQPLGSVTECAAVLERYGRHHSRALLYRCRGDAERAMAVWVQLADGKIRDELFPGIQFLADYLAKLPDHELVWKHAQWLLDKDQLLAVKIFTERPEKEAMTESMQPERIVDFLARYPAALFHYLQYLVFRLKLQKEQFHTHLAMLLLDRVLSAGSDTPPNQLMKARTELRHMLQMSDLYQVQLLLGKIRDTDLHAECAILYGKLEDHDKALRILVLKLRDYDGAEQYCLLNSEGKEPALRKRLFHTLLSVYLDPNNERRDAMSQPAIKLLNNNKEHFDARKVLAVLPESWSLSVLEAFVTSSLRDSLHTSRTTRLHRMLARSLHTSTSRQKMMLSRNAVVITEDRTCPVCGHAFTDAAFARYPNGVITHTHCARNPDVCPVTGKLFRAVSPPPPGDSNVSRRGSSPSKHSTASLRKNQDVRTSGTSSPVSHKQLSSVKASR